MTSLNFADAHFTLIVFQTDQDDDYYDDGYDDSRVELPNRPTPYEVWATKNEVTKVAKAPRVMMDEEWDGAWMHALKD